MVPSGLYYNPAVLSAEQQQELLTAIEVKHWSKTLSRRTQHYGHRYDYLTKRLYQDVEPITTCPGIALIGQLLSTAVPDFKLEQAIVNEYTAKQTIGSHIDAPVFGPIIVTVCLGSSGVLRFRRGSEIYDLTVNAGDIVFLTGEARTQWSHCTLPQSGVEYRRISVTLRSLT